jgi:hypothetical protein
MANFGESAILLGQLSDFRTEALVPSPQVHSRLTYPVSELLSVAHLIAMRMSGLFHNRELLVLVYWKVLYSRI